MQALSFAPEIFNPHSTISSIKGTPRNPILTILRSVHKTVEGIDILHTKLDVRARSPYLFITESSPLPFVSSLPHRRLNPACPRFLASTEALAKSISTYTIWWAHPGSQCWHNTVYFREVSPFPGHAPGLQQRGVQRLLAAPSHRTRPAL